MQESTTELNFDTLKRRLRAPVTVTAPGWAFALAGFAVLVVLGVALD